MNDDVGYIDVVVPTKADDDVPPIDNADNLYFIAVCMKDVDDDDDEPSNCVANVDNGMEGMHGVVNEVATNTALAFRDEYARSIKPMITKVDSLFACSMEWSTNCDTSSNI